MSEKKDAPPCSICKKKTKRECSHVDCPNRRDLTAQEEDLVEIYGDPGDGTYRVKPIYEE